ncbi:MAG: hypothetical protein QMD00_05940 [Hadesarchaea archaeon]|nr:hypothetical protein [Hadesarchaea archaeon]
MYYQRLDVRRAIMDFANASGSFGLRESAFYNSRVKSMQRYIGENGSKHPVTLDSPAAVEQALSLGASAFYCSYWRHDGHGPNHPTGRDLVWTIRAERGGLEFAKLTTVRVLEALAEAGIEPWVKYCGDLGFDLIIPLEAIPYEAWSGNLEALSEIQEELTNYIEGYLCEHFSDITIEGTSSPIEIKRGTETCLLSELRVRRGLLLAPMSLNPETGLVSVPVDPKQVGSFSIFDASPGNVWAFEWVQPSRAVYGLMRYARAWQPASAQTKLAIA